MATYKIEFRQPDKNKLCRIKLRVTINRVHKRFDISKNPISWHRNYIDEKKGRVKKWDSPLVTMTHDDLNELIEKKLGLLREGIRRLNQRDKKITFLEIENILALETGSKLDIQFVINYEAKRCEAQEVSKSVERVMKNSLKRLENFNPKINFSQLSEEKLMDFKIYLLQKGYKNNTIRQTFVNLKKAGNLAYKKGNFPVHPDLADFSLNIRAENSKIALSEAEVLELIKLLETNKLKENEAFALYDFLYSTFTSLRLSDVKQTKKENKVDFINNTLTYVPFKTRRQKPDPIKIPITETALKFFQTKVQYSDSWLSRLLKRCMKKAGINKDVTFHTARHTYATIFRDKGGTVDVLMRLMGHSDIKTTMGYYSLSDSKIKSEAQIMNIKVAKSNTMTEPEIQAKIETLQKIEKELPDITLIQENHIQKEIAKLNQEMFEILSKK